MVSWKFMLPPRKAWLGRSCSKRSDSLSHTMSHLARAGSAAVDEGPAKAADAEDAEDVEDEDEVASASKDSETEAEDPRTEASSGNSAPATAGAEKKSKSAYPKDIIIIPLAR